jgi:hypothetical protein
MTKRIIAVIAFALLLASPAYARGHHHHHAHRRHHHTIVVHSFQEGLGHGLAHMLGSIERVPTAAGPITVASGLADRFQGLIADFVAHGYTPHEIGCFARGGHVRGSRHYAGAACDFDQTGWGRTAHFMYTSEAAAIIRAHGLRNGCEFRDCGHVDDGESLRRWARR